jgi:DNA ligase (NAD+)
MGAHPAFGRGVGVRKMKKLYDAFAGDMTLCQDFDAIVAVEGFEAKTAKKIVAGYKPFMDFFADIEEYVTIQEYVAPKEGKLTGCVFVFTGFRSKELEAKVEALGGKIGSSVSSKTTYLVADNPDSTSGKAQKARDVGIKVIGVPELQAMLA